jgi:hypothetical protein
MKSTAEVKAYFYEDPSERSFLDLADTLHYFTVKGTMTQEYADKILEEAKKYLRGD